MYRTLLLALLLTVIFAKMATQEHYHSKYKAWKSKHSMSFEATEEKYRMFLFKQKDAQIKAHNGNSKNNYKLGHNQFSCLTFEEFSNSYLGALPPPEEKEVGSSESNSPDSNSDSNSASDSSASEDSSVSVVAPKSHKTVGGDDDHPNVKFTAVNWRSAGGITGVRNQGRCGSCWAFATTAAIESSRKIQLSKGGRLSEQQLVDCVYDRTGCRGGWMSTAMRYVVQHNGIQKNKKYPYSSSGYQPCPRGNIGGPAKIYNFTESPNSDCAALRDLIAVRPATVALCANSNFQSYDSGVFDGCSSTCSINHAVLAYGYTATGHWRIKNSWGKGWGMNGHMKLKKNDMCRVCRYGGENTHAKR